MLVKASIKNTDESSGFIADGRHMRRPGEVSSNIRTSKYL